DPHTSSSSLPGPFYVYLLASAITAIAAIGSVFEYVNQRPVFGVLKSDSIFYAPLLGFLHSLESLLLHSEFSPCLSSELDCRHSYGLNLSKLQTEKLRSKTGVTDGTSFALSLRVQWT
ncbi:hypothetical protein RJ641_036820, partial [Dillenia turbinata]